MNDSSGIREIPTCHGPFSVPKDWFIPLFGDRLARVDCERLELLRSGFYTHRLLCWDARDGFYHRFGDLHSLLRWSRHALDWEGFRVADLAEGEHQSLLTWTATHERLRYVAATLDLTPEEREELERDLVKVSEDIGTPIDDVKRDIQLLTLQAAQANDADKVVELLDETMVLDRQRTESVEQIAGRLNLRAVAILRLIIDQSEIINDCLNSVSSFYARHVDLKGSGWAERPALYKDVQAVVARLQLVRDSPFAGLARRIQKDLSRYLYEAAEGAGGVYLAAGVHLERIMASRLCYDVRTDMGRSLQLLAKAQRKQGARKEELEAKARLQIDKIRVIDPRQGDKLDNNTLWTMVGRANDANKVLSKNSGRKGWDEAKFLLKVA